jgi:hypothetical protein
MRSIGCLSSGFSALGSRQINWRLTRLTPRSLRRDLLVQRRQRIAQSGGLINRRSAPRAGMPTQATSGNLLKTDNRSVTQAGG